VLDGSAALPEDRLYRVFAELNTTASGRTTQEETTLYFLEATGGFDRLNLTRAGFSDVSEESFQAVVTGEGVVRSYRIRYLAEAPEGTVTVTERYRTTALGDAVDLSRPDWVPAALAEGNETRTAGASAAVAGSAAIAGPTGSE
jgi:hypothetical protein